MNKNDGLREKLTVNRDSGIHLDRMGRFWHRGQPITHKRTQMALLRWLDVQDDGRPILRLDEERFAYRTVEEALLIVVAVRRTNDRIFVSLNDKTEEELAYQSLMQTPDNVIYCLVRDARLLARLTTSAYYTLADSIVEDANSFKVAAWGQSFPVRQVQCQSLTQQHVGKIHDNRPNTSR